MPIHGSCHCGKIAYTLDEDVPAQAMACNCSICRRKAYLHHFSTPDKFTLHGARDDIQIYTFNRHAIRHGGADDRPLRRRQPLVILASGPRSVRFRRDRGPGGP
jgi:hypothetical protein